MFFRHGSPINWITFPGVIVHELTHQLLCRFYGIPVFKVVYFQTRNPAGYVLHETPDNKSQSIILQAGPFLVNTILGFIISLPAVFTVFGLNKSKPLDYFLVYLGISIAMHAFPCTGDGKANLLKVKAKDIPLTLKVVGYPVASLIYINSLKRFSWLHILYGIVIAIVIPHLLVKLMV